MKDFVKVVLMAKDELGDDFRVNSEVYTIPRCVYEDVLLMEVWEIGTIAPWKERYPEAYNFHFEIFGRCPKWIYADDDEDEE